MKKEILWESLHIDDLEDNGLLEEEEIPEGEEQNYTKVVGSLINTPVGVFNVDDRFNPLRRFELRVGYTNFNVSKKVAMLIEKTPGVEAFNVLTRYQFIIGIGKLFSFDKVRQEIEAQITKDDKPVTGDDEVVALAERLTKEFHYWGIYQFPNGQIDSFGTQSYSDYQSKIELYNDAHALSSGLLLTSEGDNGTSNTTN